MEISFKTEQSWKAKQEFQLTGSNKLASNWNINYPEAKQHKLRLNEVENQEHRGWNDVSLSKVNGKWSTQKLKLSEFWPNEVENEEPRSWNYEYLSKVSEN